MSDIAKNLADRIREKAAAGDLTASVSDVLFAPPGPGPLKTRLGPVEGAGIVAPTGKAARALANVTSLTSGPAAERMVYKDQAKRMFNTNYGADYDEAARLFIPENELVYGAAEEGIPVAEFVHTFASQFALTSVVDFDREVAHYTAGENAVKVALRGFSFSEPEWSFSDGYAVRETANGTTVVAPSYDESRHAWQCTGYGVACEKEAFLSMTAQEKAAVPAESHVYGDIDDCAAVEFKLEPVTSSLRM